MEKRKTTNQSFLRFLFVLYGVAMLWLLFGRNVDWDTTLSYRQMLKGNINLQPLRTVGNYLYVLEHSTNAALRKTAAVNLGGNVLLFIPAGILLPKLWQPMGNFFRFFALCVGVIFVIESVQLLTLLGSFDVDDLILNVAGMTIGFILFWLVKAVTGTGKEKR